MVVNVAKMQDAKAGTVSQVTAESVRRLAAAQVAMHRLIFASGSPMANSIPVSQGRRVDRLVHREMHVNQEYVCRDSVAYAQQIQTLVANPDTSATVSCE